MPLGNGHPLARELYQLLAHSLFKFEGTATNRRCSGNCLHIVKPLGTSDDCRWHRTPHESQHTSTAGPGRGRTQNRLCASRLLPAATSSRFHDPFMHLWRHRTGPKTCTCHPDSKAQRLDAAALWQYWDSIENKTKRQKIAIQFWWLVKSGDFFFLFKSHRVHLTYSKEVSYYASMGLLQCDMKMRIPQKYSSTKSLPAVQWHRQKHWWQAHLSNTGINTQNLTPIAISITVFYGLFFFLIQKDFVFQKDVDSIETSFKNNVTFILCFLWRTYHMPQDELHSWVCCL